MSSISYEVLAVPHDSHLSLMVEGDQMADRLTHTEWQEAAEKLSKDRVLEVENDGTVSTLVFDLARIGRRRDKSRRYEDLTRTTTVMAAVGNYPCLDETCPNLSISLGTEFTSGRLPMVAQVKWPEGIKDKELAARATQTMRTVAKDLGYARDVVPGHSEYQRLIRDLVYADVQRQRWVSLQTNPMGSCALDTDGDEYSAEDHSFELWAHNLYSPDQQIICWAGAAALAGK